MPYQQDIRDNAHAVLSTAAPLLDAYRCAGKVPVLLVPTAEAVRFARAALSREIGLFGVRVETLDAWVADRWELYGDGRRIVSAGERELLLQRVLDQASEDPSCGAVRATPGTIALVARLASEALPSMLDAARDDALRFGLSDAEQAVLRALGRYADALDALGRCELSQAAHALERAMEEPPPLVLAGMDDVPCACERMLATFAERANVVRLDDGCAAPDDSADRAPELKALLERLFEPAQSDPVKPTGAVRFLLPSGGYAAPALLVECVAQAVARERAAAQDSGADALPVVVAARDPRALFDSTADALAARGVRGAVSARRAFAETAFGRAFLALLSFSCDDGYRVSQASDFALSWFSGLSQRAAYDLDAAWRADRTVDRARIADDLAQASETAARALSALARGDADAALAVFEERLRRAADMDAAFRAEQLAAVSCARSFVAACAETGASVLGSRGLLERASVAAGACAVPCEDAGPASGEVCPDAVFLSLEQASRQPSCSCATLVLCDLSAADYPVRAAEDAAVLLMEKTGLCDPPDALARARKRLFRAVSTARDAVVLERPLNTQAADESYPAVMYEELVDCYRSSSDGDGAQDRATGLPLALTPYANGAGEDALHANLALSSYAGSDASSWDVPVAGAVSKELRPCVVVPRRMAADEADKPRMVLSPSAVESYLECPCKWFALRRLRLSEPDAGFGPVEMGSFSHSVLKSFYEHFRETGQRKVNEGNLPEARVLLRDVFARHLAFQPQLKPRSNPLIPRTKFEEAETADLQKKLEAYLDREAQLLPGFAPAYLEFDFGAAEEFSYAGFLLRGSVDRIDVNDQGQAVVIDYKGSVSRDYALEAASPAAQAGGVVLPHKVQALMYAQVARRVLGLDVVGAVYVSYGRDRKVAGAVDRTVLGEDALCGLSMEACGVPGPAADALGVSSFDALADAVEERIGVAADLLSSGLIGPDPRGKDPCGYCPVRTCERRRSS